jgi:charged multivesicular body protein 4
VWLYLCRNIDDIESAIEEANEQTENMREIQQALATPVGASADFDEVLLILPSL